MIGRHRASRWVFPGFDPQPPWVVCWLLGSLLSGRAALGLLETTDHQSFRGEIRIETNGFKIVVQTGSAVPVDFGRVRLVQMDVAEAAKANAQSRAARGGSQRPPPVGSPAPAGPSLPPSTAVPPASPAFAEAGLEIEIPRGRGVLLCDGSFLTWGIRGVEQNQLQLWSGTKGGSVSLSQVARIHYGEFKPPVLDLLRQARPGVLLWGGEFVEGDVKSLSERQVSVSSVLFGPATYDLNGKVAALVLRPPAPRPCPYVVRLRNGTLLRVDGLECAKGALVVKEGALANTRIHSWDLLEIRRRAQPTHGG